MRWRKTKLVAFGGVVVALVVLGNLVAKPNVPPRPAGEKGKHVRLKSLLKERHAALKAVADAANEEFLRGRTTTDQVAEAQRAMYRSELDLCDTDLERVAVLEKMVVEAQKSEKRAEALREVGRIPISEALKTRAIRLEAEIDLERARVK